MTTDVTAATERLLADLAGRAHCRWMPRGATAIFVACRLVGEERGFGEVIVPTVGCLSIPQAVALAGHRPVFADVDRVTGCLCPEDLARRVTGRTKAVLPIHIFGHVADVERIDAVAGRHGLAVVEDACHAFGGRMGGGPVGSWGAFSIASFGGTKALGGRGGGALFFDDADTRTAVDRHLAALAPAPDPEAAELLALSHRNLYHAAVDVRRARGPDVGTLTLAAATSAYRPLLVNGREAPMPALQAVADSVARLADLASRRLQAARFYDAMLAGTPCRRPAWEMLERAGMIWRYTFTCPCPQSTQDLTRRLRRAGIHASNHYWSLAEIWDGSDPLPGTAWFQERVVNLWVDAAATPEYLDRTAAVVAAWARGS
jgi:dTDP-4-amino-4,6-dideoxygalactose transaminase